MNQPKLDLRGRKWKVAETVEKYRTTTEWEIPAGHLAYCHWENETPLICFNNGNYREKVFSQKHMLILDTTDAPRIETAIKKEKEDA